MIDIPDIQKDIQLTKNKIKELQYKTVECVSFAPSGKVTVTDKCHLEELNSEIDRLSGLVEHNGTALARLEELTGGKTLADLQLNKRRLDGHIQKVTGCLSADLGELFKRHPGLDMGSLATHPKAVKLQADAKAAIDGDTPELERLTALLAQADEILSGYRPSGLKEATQQYTPFTGGI